jgi:ABC-type branched-subunit amino acid transport system substrate-binding protein
MRRNCTRALLVFLALVILPGCATPPSGDRTGFPPAPFTKPPPKEAEALRQQAEQAEEAGKIPSAISLWERIIQRYPQTNLAAEGLYRVGHIYLEQGQAERSLQYFDYLLYTYPRWDGADRAELDRLRALWKTGRKKEVMKKAMPFWNASEGQREVQVGLSLLMAEAYQSEGDIETAFDWLAAGFSVSKTPDDKKSLTQATVALMKSATDSELRKLLSRKPSDFMRVFLEFGMAQRDTQTGPSEETRQRLRTLLTQNPGHPIAPEIQAMLRGGAAAAPETTVRVDPNHVGGLVPLNGPYRQYGQMVLRGLTTALEDWRRIHPDDEISLIVRDAQADPDQAAKSFEELTVQEGALAVIGPLGAPAVKAVSPSANRLGVPLLALASKDDESADNSFLVHIFLNERELVRTLLRYCHDKLGYTRFATLYPDDRYGQRLSKIFAEAVREQGGSLLASIPYKEKSTDFKDPIQKLMNVAKQNIPPTGVDTTPFEALFIPDQVQTISLIAPQLPYHNVVGATLLGTNLWGESSLVQAGGAYVEQAIFATPYLPESQSPRIQRFKEKFQTLYPSFPSYLEAQAYDAMLLFLEARSTLRSSSSMDRSALIESLLSIRDFEGVAGSYSFTSQGELKRDYSLFQVLDGQLTPLTP